MDIVITFGLGGGGGDIQLKKLITFRVLQIYKEQIIRRNNNSVISGKLCVSHLQKTKQNNMFVDEVLRKIFGPKHAVTN